jgi:hypothetical protein
MRSFLNDTALALDISIFHLTDLTDEVHETYTQLMPEGSKLTIVSCSSGLFRVIFDKDSFNLCGNIYYNESCEYRPGLSGTFLFNRVTEYTELKHYFLLNQLLHKGETLKSALKTLMMEGLQKLTMSEYWDHDDILFTCTLANEVAELNIVRNMRDDYIQIMPYFPSYFFEDKDIMFKSQNDASRDLKIEEYYERVMIVLKTFIKLMYTQKLSTIRDDLKVCDELEDYEIELLVDWLLSPLFYQEFESCAELSINEGKSLEEEITAMSRNSPEFNIIINSGLHMKYPQVFADAKQHFLANYIKDSNIIIDLRTGRCWSIREISVTALTTRMIPMWPMEWTVSTCTLMDRKCVIYQPTI